MQDNIWLNTGAVCALGLATLGVPASTLGGDSPAKSSVAVKSPKLGASRQGVLRTAKKIVVRAQDNPFEDEWQPEADVRGRARVVPISAIETPGTIQQVGDEVTAPDEGATPTDSAALKRLKERSAKERYEKLHQEWLKNRRERANQLAPTRPTPSEIPKVADESADPFATESQKTDVPVESELPPATTDPGERVDPLPNDFTGERPVRAPRIEPGKTRLQSQPKPKNDVTSEEDLNKIYLGEESNRLAPPVRDPKDLPKISDILPVPKPRSKEQGRQIPEDNIKPDDPNRYIKLEDVPFLPRSSPEFVYAWEATNFTHNPLYFEDPTLERYGHSLPPFIQPIVSIGKFSGQLAFLPYQMTIHPPTSRVSPLGWYAPGDCVPYRMHQVPLNGKAAAVQAATILGLSYGLP